MIVLVLVFVSAVPAYAARYINLNRGWGSINYYSSTHTFTCRTGSSRSAYTAQINGGQLVTVNQDGTNSTISIGYISKANNTAQWNYYSCYGVSENGYTYANHKVISDGSFSGRTEW